MRSALLAAASVAAIGFAAATTFVSMNSAPAPGPGIAIDLAIDRAARISQLSYDVSFAVPAAKTQSIHGRLKASFSLSDASKPLAFDFAQPGDHLLGVQANGHVLPASIERGHIVIPASALIRGNNEVSFDFIAGDEPLHRNDDFLYTLFVPARASHAMPCFDQPNAKAKWRLTLDVPADWKAVSNGAERARSTEGAQSHLAFAETEPLPPYLFAFAAGKFNIETAERDGRTFHMYHRENDAAKVARNRDAIFDLHASALAWLTSYTDVPFPFGKFDFVLIPSFQFGGMEHAGAIFYNEGPMLLDPAATVGQRLYRANLIAHETAHMWFGDLVTMRWFDDVWMKEVFANFMAAKIVNPSFPEVNHALHFFLDNYPAAYAIDRTEGANPIRQKLENLDQAGSLYGAIIYQKAPIVMRQLELLVGEDPFRDGVRQYLKRFAFGNAAWPDLIRILDEPTPADLAAWSRAWVDEPGRPAIRTEVRSENGHLRELAFVQHDPRGRSLSWPERLTVVLGYPSGVKTLEITLGSARTEVAEAVGLPAPLWILPVGGGLGYGAFELDDGSREALMGALPDIVDPVTRGAATVTLWELMLDGKIPPSRMLELLLSALPRESDELNAQAMLGELRTLFWRFTDPRTRLSAAPRIEAMLREGLAKAKTTSLRAQWFHALESMAITPPTLDWLASIWRHDAAIEGLPLAEADEADLALELAVRDRPDAAEILHGQLARFQNPDRKARFAFVMPAMSSDAAVRDGFFEGLKRVENRHHEAWVLEAASYLHHPLRADSSEKYIRPALDLVREIQRTGDIFFPKRWADATLGGHCSPRAAEDVRAFLKSLPVDYPPRLRWVVQSSADILFRAAAHAP